MPQTDFTGTTFPQLHIGQAVLAKFITLSADPMSSNRDTTPTYKGRVVYINERHKHATVETELRGGTVRENFKTWEVMTV